MNKLKPSITLVVNRDRAPREALSATGRSQYTNLSVVDTMPRGGAGTATVTIEFFNLGQLVSDDLLAKEYEKRGLIHDPYALAAVNQADPTFADEQPNGTHWKDGDGKWCFAAFDRNGVERCLRVNRGDNVWPNRWWFGGVHKPVV